MDSTDQSSHTAGSLAPVALPASLLILLVGALHMVFAVSAFVGVGRKSLVRSAQAPAGAGRDPRVGRVPDSLPTSVFHEYSFAV